MYKLMTSVKVYIDNLFDIIYKLLLSKDIILLGIGQAYKTLQHGPLRRARFNKCH